MNITKYINNKKTLIDKALRKFLPPSNTKPSVIHKAMRYAVFSGGKRIRPVLTIAAFEACGGKNDSIMKIAGAIEIIHTYTLIHDDLPCMDNDDFRRGRQSCHKKFGEDIALLAGDALLTLSFRLLAEAGSLEVISEISDAVGSAGTIGGQVADIRQVLLSSPRKRGSQKMDSRFRGNDKKREMDYITTNKTGKLFETAVKSAGLFKGVDEKKIKALSDFGKCVGFTFQLIDDIMDKDGYCRVYDENYIRKKAKFLTDKAKTGLKVFGKKADNLAEIADLILQRKA
jgi:geranylgeranyl diphosphate synthase, type II